MAAELASMILLQKNGTTIVLDCQVPDAVASSVTFTATSKAAATSPASFRVPEACVITDFSILTGTTCTGMNLLVNGTSIPVQIRFANYLNTLSFRPALRIPLAKGDFLSATTN